MKNKYYAYFFSEKQKGVCESWADCEKMVKGKNARYRGFSSREEAEEWLQEGARYKEKVARKLEPGIYFDAGTGRGRGVEISVTDENGKDLLDKILPKKKLNKYHKHLIIGKNITNNYGELLACKYALILAIKNNSRSHLKSAQSAIVRAVRVFGDSKLVIDFWSQGILRRKLLPKKTIKLVEEVYRLRKEFEKIGGVVERISGDDNPADLGFHR